MQSSLPPLAHAAPAPVEAWFRYGADAAWRTLALMDLLRQRADNMLDHEAAGMPPLLHFEAEPVADAHDFDEPCNYRLLRITRCGTDRLERHVRRNRPPVLIIDPRAGHGPGIGGFKRDAEVGMALREGHPVYFTVFDPEPVPGQTMGAVLEALAAFVDLVAQRHQGKAPIVYGNCQGGWAAVLALAHCGREAGLVVLNGSPLSYWAGEADLNPMRLLGGLVGGVWPAHFAADLGDGRFDGAWLVQNFESLRPEGTWKKYDQVLADPGREAQRFLEFERWWSGFYKLGREELLAIVRDLFVGNRVETGEVVVDGHCRADLAHLKAPLVVFSSYGDNITPPHQALAWVKTVHGSTEALVERDQRIVYLLQQQVGHLGIFVSADVARREHRTILHHALVIAALPPGLYEMKLDPTAGPDEAPAALFEPRRVEDLPFQGRPEAFARVQQISELLDQWYGTWVSPFVRQLANPLLARWLEAWHPMRTTRLAWSERTNPMLAALPYLRWGMSSAGAADEARADNPWYLAERGLAEGVHESLATWRHIRDRASEAAFAATYGN